MSRNKKHFINLFIMYLAIFLGFFNSFFRAKVFTPEEIGVLSSMYTLSLIVNIFIVFGSNSAILKYYVRFQTDKRKKTGFLLFSSLIPLAIIAVACLLFYIFKSEILMYYNDALLVKYYDYLYALFVFNLITTNMDMIFRAEEMSHVSNFINNLINKFLTGLFLIYVYIFASGKFKPFMIFTVLLLGIQGVLFLLLYFKKIPVGAPDFSFVDKTYIRDYYKFSIFMFFSQTSSRLTEWIDKIFLGLLLNMSSVGIYTIVSSFVNLVKVIERSIGLSAGVQISKAWAKKDMESLAKSYRELTDLPLALSLIILLYLIGWGKEVLLLFDREYVLGYSSMIILTISSVVTLATGVSALILKFSDKYRFDLYIQFILLIMAVGTNIILIPPLGLVGAALATAISVSIYNIFKLFLVFKLFKIQPYSWDSFKIILQFLCNLLFVLYVLPKGREYKFIELFVVAVILGIYYILTGAYIFKIKVLKELVRQLIKKIS